MNDQGPRGLVGRLQLQAKAVLAGFSTGQKAVTVIAVLGVVIGAYLFSSWAGKPSYVPLFTNLSSSDAAAMTSKLTAAKVPYQLGNGGQEILVPQSDVYQQRLNMSAAGLPSDGNQGYTLLDKAGVTTSDFQQQVEYQQAVEDVLQKTIESISGVNSAVVNVVIPQQSIFASTSNTNKPTASVLVSLASGATLGAEQVQAIVHLVASSVENLAPADVTVVDSNGNVLNAPGTDSGAVAASTIQQQQTNAYEQNLDTNLQNMLATVLGPGKAVVQVNATLNFDQTQTTTQIYDPNKTGPIPVSQATQQEIYSGASAAQQAQGALGVTTTTASPTTTVAGAPAGGVTTTTVAGVPTYTQTGQSQQNALSSMTSSTQSAPGGVQRLSVAVLVDKSVTVSPAEIKQLVSAAAGLQPSRGDQIQVGTVAFNQTAAKAAAKQLEAASKASSQAKMSGDIRTAVVVLAVLALLGYALRRITKTTRTPMVLPSGYQALELEPVEADTDEDPLDADLRTMVLQPAPAARDPQSDVKRVGTLIEEEPERIADLLRSWLDEHP